MKRERMLAVVGKPPKTNAGGPPAAVALSRTEASLLCILASAPGRTFSRETLMRSMYSDHRIVSIRTVDAHVKNLRRKLQAADSQRTIASVYGGGYRLETMKAQGDEGSWKPPRAGEEVHEGMR
jgi:DNA-binding response OmpR family regulator